MSNGPNGRRANGWRGVLIQIPGLAAGFAAAELVERTGYPPGHWHWTAAIVAKVAVFMVVAVVTSVVFMRMFKPRA